MNPTSIQVAHISCVYPPYKGGIGNVCYEQCHRITQYGYQVDVLTPNYKHTAQQNDPAYVKRLKPFVAYGNAAFLPGLSKEMKKYDVLHFHYPFLGTDLVLVCSFLWNRYVRKKKQSLILHYHMDLIPNSWLRYFYFFFTNLLVLPVLLRMSDRVVVTSYDYGKNSRIANFLEKNPQKVRIIPNGVDTKRFFPKDRNLELANQFGISERDQVILFVGGLDQAHAFKGLHVLIHAVSQLPAHMFFHLKVLVVGSGELKAQYEKQVKEMGLDHVFIFAGNVSDALLPDMYRLGHVLALPSTNKSEAFGMVLIEAMACSRPVITSDLPGVRSVVNHEQNGILVPAHDISELCHALYRMLTDPLLTQKMGKAGYQKVKQCYDWSIVTDRLHHLYQELLYESHS